MSAEVEVPATGELYCATCEQTYLAGDRCPEDNTRLVRIAKSGDQMIGRELDGRYTIVEKLGQGGMGAVYRGTQHSVGREVAIKVVTPSLVSDPIVIKRFLREAKLASRLSHPNAVSVLDFGQTEDGLFYLIMELVEGRTLDKVVAADRMIPPARLIRIGAQICDALEGAHRLQIIHRDLTPSNVMLMTASRDLVKVLDFGLAKSLTPRALSATMTNAGALLGTPAFMPPELVTGGEVDARADSYSLGCLLHYASSGALPFIAGSVHELIAMHATEPPPPLPHLPPGLSRVIAKLLSKEPRDRYQSASETRVALEASLATTTSPAAVAEPEPDPELQPSTTTVLGWAGTTTVPGRTGAAPAVPRTSTGEQKPLAKPRTSTGEQTPLVKPRTSTGEQKPLTPAPGIPLVGRALTPAAGSPLATIRPSTPSTPSSGIPALSRTITPVRASQLAPAEVEQLQSSPTLLATADAIQIVVPKPEPTIYPETSTAKDLLPRGNRRRVPILLGVSGAVIAIGAIIAFAIVHSANDSEREPATRPAPSAVPAPAPPVAPPPVSTPAPAVAPAAVPAPTAVAPAPTEVAPPPPIIDPPPQPMKTPPKTVVKPRPPKTPKPPIAPKTEPTPPGPVRVNPGVM